MQPSRPFSRLLVANRGEIARRIMRTARRMGIHTIAVCSEADENALFALEADERHVIGPAAPKESYLRIDRILEVAAKARAEAIHPGYGFLSENAGFARAVRAAGVMFVGPSGDAMEKVGNKLSARRLAETAGVPIVPGSPALASVEEAKRWAETMGYPVMLKASSGGGGIGMAVAEDVKKLERAFEDVAKKGAAFFSDATLYLEKRIERPAHVEVQILADRRGRVTALGERDCTVQRRNQKVLEETPSPRLEPPMRAAMLDAATRLAEAAGYENAGTVEMIVSGGADPRFYFLEVNSRLQVEHPVTEAVTGLDLVEAQLWIAAGEPLSPELERPETKGHAIEARLCAEDPDKRFFPSPGTIQEFVVPDGVRVDSGVGPGSVVPPSYDSLLAKLVVHDVSRELAIERMGAAIAATRITGIKTNLSVFPKVLASAPFRAGTHDTGLLAELGFRY